MNRRDSAHEKKIIRFRPSWPAVIYADGTQAWFLNGERHRENDQPAIIYADGTQQWFVNGNFIRKEDPPEMTKPAKKYWK